MSGEDVRLLGRWGEAQVAEDLRRRGWTVLAANYRCRFGEVDLIAQNREYLIFVEVKLRKDDRFAPARAFVTEEKQRKLRSTAEFFLAGYKTKRQPRFDVAEVYAPQGIRTGKPAITYIENAF